MIKKNDCVPKKVLNQQKLRRQAIAVMVGGLVVAFLLGLVVGWFIPKNDKKNVIASAEAVIPDPNASVEIYTSVGGRKFTSIFSFVFHDFSNTSVSRSTVYSLFLEVDGTNNVVGSFFGLRTSFSAVSTTVGNVFGSTFYRVPFDFSGNVSDSEVLSSSGNDLSVVPTFTAGTPNISSFSIGSIIPHKVAVSLGRLSYFFNFSGAEGTVPTFSFEFGGSGKVLSFLGLATEQLPILTSSSFESFLLPLYVTYDGSAYNPNLIYTQGQYDSYGNNRYNAGRNEGYNSGYAAGVAAGGNNNFMSLITAVVDAPITAFTSLLDFDIFGYNMKDLALALLTAGLLVAAIRFFSRL